MSDYCLNCGELLDDFAPSCACLFDVLAKPKSKQSMREMVARKLSSNPTPTSDAQRLADRTGLNVETARRWLRGTTPRRQASFAKLEQAARDLGIQRVSGDVRTPTQER